MKKACNIKYFEWLVVYNVIVAKNYVVELGKIGQLLVVMILVVFLRLEDLSKVFMLFCAHINYVIHSNMFITSFFSGCVLLTSQTLPGNFQPSLHTRMQLSGDLICFLTHGF